MSQIDLISPPLGSNIAYELDPLLAPTLIARGLPEMEIESLTNSKIDLYLLLNQISVAMSYLLLKKILFRLIKSLNDLSERINSHSDF